MVVMFLYFRLSAVHVVKLYAHTHHLSAVQDSTLTTPLIQLVRPWKQPFGKIDLVQYCNVIVAVLSSFGQRGDNTPHPGSGLFVALSVSY